MGRGSAEVAAHAFPYRHLFTAACPVPSSAASKIRYGMPEPYMETVVGDECTLKGAVRRFCSLAGSAPR
jgi:hypothetical protein